MTLTHAQLLDAVRAAGRDRESFTCADVRQQLGLSTADRRQMNRFYKLFGALQKDEANQIEKLGSNCYRLRVKSAAPCADAPVAEVVQAPSEPAIAAVLEAAPEGVVSEFVLEAEAELLPPSTVLTSDVESSPRLSEVITPAPASRPAPKPRAHWLSWMVNLFSRRAGRSEVAPGVAVGA